jgi:hypothetical protein
MKPAQLNGWTHREALENQAQTACNLANMQAQNSMLTPRQTKLKLAKAWLKENGGAHPGCLDRFMKSRGMA